MGQIPKCLYNKFDIDIEIADYDITKKTHYFKERLDDYKYLWKESLNNLGTVSHRGETDCEMCAEVNFGYKKFHEKYHQLQIKKITKRINLRKENQMISESIEVKKVYLISKLLKQNFYHTTGNPTVDKKVYLHEDKLILTSVLTDMFIADKSKYKIHELEYDILDNPSLETFKIAYGVSK